MIRLLTLDLDGTLLRSDGSLSTRSRETLAEAARMGWIVFPVTARPSRNVLPLARAEGWSEVACSNGAVTLTATGEVLDAAPLDPTAAQAFVRTARRVLPGVTFGAEWGDRMASETVYLTLRSGANPVDVGWDERVDDVLDVLSRPGLLKLMARHPGRTGLDLLEPLRAAGSLTVTPSSANFAEITAPGADKVRAVAAACVRHQVGRENVVAFGDMPIDAPLLRWAGRGVAVSNAHTEALEAADEVTLSHDEDGVALVIERLMDQSSPG